MRALLLLALASCGIQEAGGGLGLDLPGLDLVYQCRADGVELELCWDGSEGDLETSLNANGFENARCWPTDRHAGPCWYRCPGARGANALNGSWCP